MRHSSCVTLAVLLSCTAFVARADNPPVVAGGVSKEGREAIAYAERTENYNLKLTFAGKGGIALADVYVIVRDSEGRAVIDGIARGPILLAELSPGVYTVEAHAGGHRHTQKVRIGETMRGIAIALPVGDMDTPAGVRRESYSTTSSYR